MNYRICMSVKTSMKLLKTSAQPNELLNVKGLIRKSWIGRIKTTRNRMIVPRKSYVQVKSQHDGRKIKIHVLILYCSVEMSVKSRTPYRLFYQCLRGPACLWPLHLLPLSWLHPDSPCLGYTASFSPPWTHKLLFSSSPWHQLLFLTRTVLPDLARADFFSSPVNSTIRGVLTILHKVILPPTQSIYFPSYYPSTLFFYLVTFFSHCCIYVSLGTRIRPSYFAVHFQHPKSCLSHSRLLLLSC